MTNNWCVGGRHYFDTGSITQYGKRNPGTKKFVEIIEGKCDICGRNKSAIFTR